VPDRRSTCSTRRFLNTTRLAVFHNSLSAGPSSKWLLPLEKADVLTATTSDTEEASAPGPCAFRTIINPNGTDHERALECDFYDRTHNVHDTGVLWEPFACRYVLRLTPSSEYTRRPFRPSGTRLEQEPASHRVWQLAAPSSNLTITSLLSVLTEHFLSKAIGADPSNTSSWRPSHSSPC
jgi:hypothetical protein